MASSEAFTTVTRRARRRSWIRRSFSSFLTRYADLVGGSPTVDAPTAYALVDGLFEQAVVGYAEDPEKVADLLADRVKQVLPKLVAA